MNIQDEDKYTVNSIALSWNAIRMALTSIEMKVIMMYKKNTSGEGSSEWQFVQKIQLDVQPLKVRWGHPDHGNSFIVKTSNNNVMAYKEMRGVNSQAVNSVRWEMIVDKNSKSPDSYEFRMVDVKFAPSSVGFAVSIIYDDGCIEVMDLSEFFDTTKPPSPTRKQQITSKPLRCFSWRKDEGGSEALVVAYSDQNTSGMSSQKDRISLWAFSPKERYFHQIHKLGQINEKINNEIEDCNWSMSNGKSFQTVCCCGRDGLIVCRFTIDSSDQVTVLDVFQDGGSLFSYPIRCKFNHVASFISMTTVDGKIKVWRKVDHHEWKEEKVVALK